MLILRIKKAPTPILAKVAKQLRNGAIIVYPTDTAYGMGCDATNAKAAARIFKIKGRVMSKALPMICADLKMAKKFFALSSKFYVLISKYWPGPLSIVVKALPSRQAGKKGIAKNALDHGTAAIRVPDSFVARKLSHLLGRPIIATSANISGQPMCYSIRAFMKQFNVIAMNAPDLIIDVGALPRRKPSTIIKTDKSGKIQILRKGPVKICPSAIR